MTMSRANLSALVLVASLLSRAAPAFAEAPDATRTPASEARPLRWSIDLAYGYSANDHTSARYQGGALTLLDVNGWGPSLGGAAELSLSPSWAIAARARVGYFGASGARPLYGFGGATPDGSLTCIAPALEATARWRPAFLFFGLGPRVGAVFVSGTAGTGASRADMTARGYLLQGVLEMGATFGEARHVSVALRGGFGAEFPLHTGSDAGFAEMGAGYAF